MTHVSTLTDSFKERHQLRGCRMKIISDKVQRQENSITDWPRCGIYSLTEWDEEKGSFKTITHMSGSLVPILNNMTCISEVAVQGHAEMLI